MSFITAPTPPTDKQKADQSGLILLSAMKKECKIQFDVAWKKRVAGNLVNKTVAEVQAFFDGYGDKAVLAFDLHSLLQELIYLTDNTWVPLVPPHAYVKNQDGTVTISALEE
jgi:hypothetical protein